MIPMLRAATHVAYTEVLRHNLLYGLCLQAVLADAIHHRPHRVQLEMMLAEEMCLQLLDFLTMKMDQLSADFTFTVIAGRLNASRNDISTIGVVASTSTIQTCLRAIAICVSITDSGIHIIWNKLIACR